LSSFLAASLAKTPTPANALAKSFLGDSFWSCVIARRGQEPLRHLATLLFLFKLDLRFWLSHFF